MVDNPEARTAPGGRPDGREEAIEVACDEAYRELVERYGGALTALAAGGPAEVAPSAAEGVLRRHAALNRATAVNLRHAVEVSPSGQDVLMDAAAAAGADAESCEDALAAILGLPASSEPEA